MAKGLISVLAAYVFHLAITTPFGGFSKWISYEPEVPERLKEMKQGVL